MNGYYELVAKKLHEYGFRYLKPGKGSHEIWTDGRVNLTIPHSRSRHTANEIMKQAGIKHKF